MDFFLFFRIGMKNVIFIFILCTIRLKSDEEMEILSLAEYFSSEKWKFEGWMKKVLARLSKQNGSCSSSIGAGMFLWRGKKLFFETRNNFYPVGWFQPCTHPSPPVPIVTCTISESIDITFLFRFFSSDLWNISDCAPYTELTNERLEALRHLKTWICETTNVHAKQS